MSEQPMVVLGSDNNLAVTLKKNDAVFTIDPTATVEAALISLEHDDKYAGDVTCLAAAVGADWALSLVIIPFLEADLADVLYQGNALIEIQVLESGQKTTWFVGASIVRGLVG